MALFESKTSKITRIEKEKFNTQIKTDIKVKQLEKEIAKINAEAEEHYRKAEAYRAAGNKDAAIDEYQDYQFANSMRRKVKKNYRMMKQVTTMVKTGTMTNDVFALLKDSLEKSSFDPAALQDVVAGNAELKAAFDYVETTLEGTLDDDANELGALEWFNSNQNDKATVPGSTSSLDEMQAEFEKVKRG